MQKQESPAHLKGQHGGGAGGPRGLPLPQGRRRHHTPEEEEQRPDPLLVVQTLNERVLSLRAGNTVSLDVIRTILAHHKIPMVADMSPASTATVKRNDEFAIVLYHSGHFVMCWGTERRHLLDVYDSRRYFAREERDATLEEVKKWLRAIWDPRNRCKIKIVMKSSGVVEQGDRAPEDSALFAINHAILAFSGTLGTYDRKVARRIVKEYE